MTVPQPHAQKPLFGAHMSVAGGLHKAFAIGAQAGCDCLQIFVKNQRQWAAGPLTEEEVAAYRAAANATGHGTRRGPRHLSVESRLAGGGHA